MHIDTSLLCNADICCGVAESRSTNASWKHTLLLQHLNKAALLWSQENDAQAAVYSYIYSWTPLDVSCCQPCSDSHSWDAAAEPLRAEIPLALKNTTLLPGEGSRETLLWPSSTSRERIGKMGTDVLGQMFCSPDARGQGGSFKLKQSELSLDIQKKRN